MEGDEAGPSSPTLKNSGPIFRLSSRYPLRMPHRHGCAMFGCMVTVPRYNARYCCTYHKEMSAEIDSISGPQTAPCIIFDGTHDTDVSCTSALLNRTADGIAVGIPTISEDVFSVLPWELGEEFHPHLLPGEDSRNWVFFCHNPPELYANYPNMRDTLYHWERKSYNEIMVGQHSVFFIRNSLSAGLGATKKQKAMCSIWGLLRYSHMGVSLFSLSRNASKSSIKRTPARPRVRETKNVPDSDVLAKTGKGKRRVGAGSTINEKKSPPSKRQARGIVIKDVTTTPSKRQATGIVIKDITTTPSKRQAKGITIKGFPASDSLIDSGKVDQTPLTTKKTPQEAEADMEHMRTRLRKYVESHKTDAVDGYGADSEINSLVSSTLDWMDRYPNAKSHVLVSKVYDFETSLGFIKIGAKERRVEADPDEEDLHTRIRRYVESHKTDAIAEYGVQSEINSLVSSTLDWIDLHPDAMPHVLVSKAKDFKTSLDFIKTGAKERRDGDN